MVKTRLAVKIDRFQCCKYFLPLYMNSHAYFSAYDYRKVADALPYQCVTANDTNFLQ